ncbi:hypothetical protein [Alcaligenes sp. CHO6]|uniref:hypothetical protein n=1 Tax=Alcaligenes sp. CHO6 TaxID=3123298 RepID=UPI0030150CA9
MRRIFAAVLLMLGVGSATAEPVIPEALAREMVEAKAGLALQYGEMCFQRVQALLLGYEAKLQDKDLSALIQGMPNDEATGLFRTGYGLEGLRDPQIAGTYSGCLNEARPLLEAP